jgi:hypothetical protein
MKEGRKERRKEGRKRLGRSWFKASPGKKLTRPPPQPTG